MILECEQSKSTRILKLENVFSFPLAFAYVTNLPPWPPLLYLLSLLLDWYQLLSGSPRLRPAGCYSAHWWYDTDDECLPFLNYHRQDTAVTHDLLCTVGDEEIVRIHSASPVSDKFNLTSAPTLIFYSGLIVFWINRPVAPLPVPPCLSLTRMHPHTHIYQKIGPCTLHVPVNQINPWERRIEPVIHGRLLRGIIILHDHSARGAQALWSFRKRCMKLFSFLCWFCCRWCLKG